MSNDRGVADSPSGKTTPASLLELRSVYMPGTAGSLCMKSDVWIPGFLVCRLVTALVCMGKTLRS